MKIHHWNQAWVSIRFPLCNISYSADLDLYSHLFFYSWIFRLQINIDKGAWYEDRKKFIDFYAAVFVHCYNWQLKSRKRKKKILFQCAS